MTYDPLPNLQSTVEEFTNYDDIDEIRDLQREELADLHRRVIDELVGCDDSQVEGLTALATVIQGDLIVHGEKAKNSRK